jgi:hypothetical protein
MNPSYLLCGGQSHVSPPVLPYRNSVNPSTTTFSEMTNLLDYLRTHFFVPLYNRAQYVYPPLSPSELTKLNAIALAITRYDRSPAMDKRGHWPFLAIAGPSEVWIAEVLLQVWFGRCGFSEATSDATNDVWFLSTLRSRLFLA